MWQVEVKDNENLKVDDSFGATKISKHSQNRQKIEDTEDKEKLSIP